jgi:hypothetical protein
MIFNGFSRRLILSVVKSVVMKPIDDNHTRIICLLKYFMRYFGVVPVGFGVDKKDFMKLSFKK